MWGRPPLGWVRNHVLLCWIILHRVILLQPFHTITENFVRWQGSGPDPFCIPIEPDSIPCKQTVQPCVGFFVQGFLEINLENLQTFLIGNFCNIQVPTRYASLFGSPTKRVYYLNAKLATQNALTIAHQAPATLFWRFNAWYGCTV